MVRWNTTQETLIPIAGFTGGVVENADHSLLKISQSSYACNVDIDNGVFKVCKGITAKKTLSNGTNNGKILTYYKDSVAYLLWANNGSITEIKTTDWTTKTIASGFTSNDFDSVNNNVNSSDVVIITNGVDNVKVWDGTTIRDVKRDGASSTDSAENKAPKGKFIELHYERLWIADDQNLYASSVTRNGFDIDDWTTPTDETEVNQHGVEIFAYTNDGTKIKGMKVIFGDIVIFKERSIFKIFGTSPMNYQKVDLFNTGAIADGSIATATHGAYFVSSDGIYLYDGTNVGLISQAISKTWDTINKDRLEIAQGVIYGDKYILAVPANGSSFNNLIIEYDLTEKTFMFKNLGININNFVFVGKDLYVLHGSKISQYNTGNNFDGSPINAIWTTPYTDFGQPNAIKELSTVYLTINALEPGNNLKITSISESKTKEKVIALKTGEHTYRINFNNRGRLMKFTIENLNGKYIEVKSFNALMELDED